MSWRGTGAVGDQMPQFWKVSLTARAGSGVSWGQGMASLEEGWGPWGGCTHHDSSGEADDLAPRGAWHNVPVADGQEGDGDQPQSV